MSCSSVVFPEPDAPMIATRSPFATLSSTPRSTSTLRPTSLNVLVSPCASRTGALLIAQRFGGRLARGGQRRIERRGHRERERQAADLQDLERPDLRGQSVEVVDLGREQIDAEQPLQETDDVADLPAEEQREQNTETRADDADQRALAREHRHDTALRGADAAQDRDVAALVAHDHHQRRN